MALWSAVLAAVLATVSLSVFLYRRHRRKQERLQLRLVAGRGHLLGEELAQAMARLALVDQAGLESGRAQAAAALDQLHMALLERQAHLQSYEELARLQGRKAVLMGTSWEFEAQAPLPFAPPEPPPRAPLQRPPASPSPAPTGPPPSRPGSSAPRDRQQLENQLLNRIEELQQSQEAARRRPGSAHKSGPPPKR
jgi:hypothetical protein